MDRTTERGRREMLRKALLLSLAPAMGLGFGRFGYALLLEPMRLSEGWSYAQAGAVASANALGYLLGTLLAGYLIARLGALLVMRGGLLLVSLGLIGLGLVPAYAHMLLLELVIGVGAALLFMGGAAVVMQLDDTHTNTLALGIYFSGPGTGIVLSSLLVPLVLGAPLFWSWRQAWMVLGVVGLLVLALLLTLDRQRIRGGGPLASTPGGLFVWNDYRRFWASLLSYLCFGLGYIGYMTFSVAFLQALELNPVLVQSFWLLVGCSAAAGNFAWGTLLSHLSPRRSLLLILAVLLVGALLPVLVQHTWSFVLSAVLFGGSFLAYVTAIARQVRVSFPPQRWSMIVSNATAAFAVGQLVGPVLTGAIADIQGGLALGLLGSAGALAVGFLVVLLGPAPAPFVP